MRTYFFSFQNDFGDFLIDLDSLGEFFITSSHYYNYEFCEHAQRVFETNLGTVMKITCMFTCFTLKNTFI